MSISFPVNCGAGRGFITFVVEDDGTIAVDPEDSEEFDVYLAEYELGFEPADCVVIYEDFKNKPIELLYSQNFFSPFDMLLVAIAIVDENKIFEETFPEVVQDLEDYNMLARGYQKVDVRLSDDIRYLRLDPMLVAADKGFVINALGLLRTMARSFESHRDLSLNRWIPMQLQHIINHTGRAIAHHANPGKRPLEILDERDREIRNVFGSAMEKLENILVVRDEVEG